MIFGVVVSYFSGHGRPPLVKESAKFSLSLLRTCKEVTSVILVDGSSSRDRELEIFCQTLRIRYAHAGKEISFGEAYNYGVSLLEEDWIAVMASDIYVYHYTFSAFGEFIEKHHELKIGCLIPYLSRSDFPVQEVLAGQRKNCYTPLMTLNLNIFRKDVFETVGGISTRYTGNYNDVEMCLKLKNVDLNVFIVGEAYALHYGRLTTQYGTNVNLESDRSLFFYEYPDMRLFGGFWGLRVDRLLRSPLLKILYLMAARLPQSRVRRKGINFVLNLIPVLQMVG